MAKGKGKRTSDSRVSGAVSGGNSISSDAPTPMGNEEIGARTVYCGNLAWSVSWQDLKDHLKQCGTVEFCEVLMYKDGRKVGSGVARFETAEEAQKAVDELFESELKGRTMLIRMDRENGVGPGSGKKGKGKALSEEQALRQVYVGNLSWKTSWRDLKQHLEEAGTVEYCDILVDKDGRSAGSGLVRFAEEAAAKQAIEEMMDTELDGRKIFIREDREGRMIKGMSESSKGKKGKGKGKNGKNDDWTVFVTGLDKKVDWKTLKERFRDFYPTLVDIGEIRNGENRGFAIVQFARATQAEDAIDAVNQQWIGENKVTVRWDNKVYGKGY